MRKLVCFDCRERFDREAMYVQLYTKSRRRCKECYRAFLIAAKESKYQAWIRGDMFRDLYESWERLYDLELQMLDGL